MGGGAILFFVSYFFCRVWAFAIDERPVLAYQMGLVIRLLENAYLLVSQRMYLECVCSRVWAVYGAVGVGGAETQSKCLRGLIKRFKNEDEEDLLHR